MVPKNTIHTNGKRIKSGMYMIAMAFSSLGENAIFFTGRIVAGRSPYE